MWNTSLTRRIGIKYPIIQAPMTGGPSTPQLAAAVSNAGGLGSLGCGVSPPDVIRSQIRETRTLTDKPFAVNLFTYTQPLINQEQCFEANKALDKFRKELGLSLNPSLPSKYSEDLDAQLQVILEEKPPVFSFTFGLPPKGFLQECQKLNIRTIGTATCPAEVRAMTDSDDRVDFVVAQGIEAGGHRGCALTTVPHDTFLGLMPLIPQLCKEKVPVIAAGGIMDGRQISACLAMGASGVALGTAFLLCPEAGTNKPYREALRNEMNGPDRKGTQFTTVYSGRLARGIRNRYMDEMAEFKSSIPEYPYMNALTTALRKHSAQAGKSDFLSLFAGQGVGRIREMSAEKLVKTLVEEAVEGGHLQHQLD